MFLTIVIKDFPLIIFVILTGVPLGKLSRYFKNDKDLVIAEFKTENLNDHLRWEVSRNNNTFPHFYNNLKFAWLNKVYEKADI